MTAHWIASRSLTQVDGVQVLVSISEPVKVRDTLWSCSFSVSRQGQDTLVEVKGYDSVQALLLTLERLRLELSKLGPLIWLGEQGDHGFPMFIPQAFGFAFSQKLEKMVDSEAVALVTDLRAKAEAKQRAMEARDT